MVMVEVVMLVVGAVMTSNAAVLVYKLLHAYCHFSILVTKCSFCWVSFTFGENSVNCVEEFAQKFKLNFCLIRRQTRPCLFYRNEYSLSYGGDSSVTKVSVLSISHSKN